MACYPTQHSLVWLLCGLLLISEVALAFKQLPVVFQTRNALVPPSLQHVQFAASVAGDDPTQPQISRPWANWALLISSWSDGVAGLVKAKTFLKQGLAIALLSEQQRQAETAVASSVLQSPCCGPDLGALQSMESVDRAIEAIEQSPDCINAILEQQLLQSSSTKIRFIYIPTAMYALRSESTNTPGKQRQRARADGKKRRNEIVQALQSLFDQKLEISVITLDLDDGSVKQPEGFDDATPLPADGKEALAEWDPHFIYIEGGNTFWLHHCLVKGDWEELLESATTKQHGAVYVGKSAGAILTGALVQTATWKGWDDPRVVPGMETYKDWGGVKGLDIIGGKSFFPHMDKEWETLVEEKRKDVGNHDVVCLRDDEVLCVKGNEQQITRLSSI